MLNISISSIIGTIIKFIIFLLLVELILTVVGFGFVLLTNIGEKVIVDETVKLPHDGSKTYGFPPGMVWIKIMPDEPIDETWSSLSGHSEGHGLTSGREGIGGISWGLCTISNPNESNATVHIRITTGYLNPFAYL